MPYITLRCGTCDNTDCPFARQYIPEESQEGCTREVNEEDKEDFYHQMEEVLPFLSRRKRTASTDATFAEVDATQQRIYCSRFGSKIDSRGKVAPRFSAKKG